MKFYRNLGAITFESETPTLQIFSASPATVLFQIKQSETPVSVLDGIVVTLNQHYHCNSFSVYSQPHKGQCILLTNSKRIELKAIDTNQLCALLMEAATIMHKSSQIFPESVGDCSLHQLRMIGDKMGFVYIPVLRQQQNNKVQTKTVEQFMRLVRQTINIKDISQKLLLKKLQKCKNIQEVIEQIRYFSSVYCVGRIQLQQSRKCLLQTTMHKKYPTKSAKKFSIFKLDLLKSRNHQHSFRSDHHYSLSQHRQSTNVMHISLPITVKHHGSAHTSQQRSSLNSTAKRDSWSKVSRVSLKNSQVKEDKAEQEKVIKRQSKLKQALCTPVNSMDEEKLLRKLRNKKRTQPIIKYEEITGVKPVIIADAKISQMVEEQSPKIDHKIEIQQKRIQSSRQIDSNDFESAKPAHITKQKTVNNKVDSPVAKDNIYATKNTTKTSSPLDTPANPPKPNETPALKKVKNKRSLLRQDFADQLEVIDLGNKPCQKTTIKTYQLHTKTKPAPQTQYAATVQNGWNRAKSQAFQDEQTKRITKTTAAEKVVAKCRKLNLIGTAVANTKAHLVNYQKIFWQLPLFFIYRGFYMRRLQIAEEAQGLQCSSQEISEILVENSKIKESNEKLIKSILKKLKKLDHSLLQSLQPYLNLNKDVNCQQLMKNFVKEYIESLTEAVQKDKQLAMHLMQVSDAYLIYRGEEVKESRRLQAEESKQIGNYMAEQRRLLQKYF